MRQTHSHLQTAQGPVNTTNRIDGWMRNSYADIRMDGWVVGWMDGWMDLWMDG